MNFFKSILRLILILAAMALLVIAVYAIWRLARNHWAPLLLAAFLIVGLVIMAFTLAAYRRARRAGGQDAVWLLAGEVQAHTRLARLRLRAERIFSALELLSGMWFGSILQLSWRALFFRGAPTAPEGIVQTTARSSLEGPAAFAAPSGLFLIAIAYGLAYVAPAQRHWVCLFIAVVAVGTTLRHLHYAVGLTSLPTLLRRIRGTPYSSFAIVVLADLLSLVLIWNALLNWRGGELFSRAGTWRVLTLLYFADAWSVVKGLWSGTEPPLAIVLLTGAGVLYNATLLKALLNFGDFRRTDEDYTSIARAYCAIGRYTDALRTLERVNAPNMDTYTVRVGAYVGVSQLEMAWQNCKLILSLKQIDPTTEKILFMIWGQAMFLPLVPKAYVELLEKFMEVGNDVSVVNALDSVLPARLTPEAAHPLFDGSDRSKRFPLSFSRLLIGDQKLDEARRLLGELKPESVPEKIFRSYLVLYSETIVNKATTKQQDLEYFEHWSREHLDQISKWISGPLDEFNGLQRVLTFGPIFLVHTMAAALQSHYEQSWQFVLDQLKKSMAGDAFARETLVVLGQLERVVHP